MFIAFKIYVIKRITGQKLLTENGNSAKNFLQKIQKYLVFCILLAVEHSEKVIEFGFLIFQNGHFHFVNGRKVLIRCLLCFILDILQLKIICHSLWV